MRTRKNIEKLIYEKSRRLQKLKEIQAKKGINTEPEILLEIEDLDAEITALEKERQDKQSKGSEVSFDIGEREASKTLAFLGVFVMIIVILFGLIYFFISNYNGGEEFGGNALPPTDETKLPFISEPPVVQRLPKFAGKGQIAFVSTHEGNPEIYVINVDGSQLKNLTNNSRGDDLYPAWSLDGNRIAFFSNRDHEKYNIWVMKTDGDDPENLTKNRITNDYHPAWSPNGEKIAFVSTRDGNEEIYVMDSKGNNLIRLTNNDTDDYTPVWSPDGGQIAFTSERDKETYESGREGYKGEIYIMNAADGSNPYRLTSSNDGNFYPAWSPDGQFIAFMSLRNGLNNAEIYTINVTNRDEDRLTTELTWDSEPTWSPDSRFIAIVSQDSKGNNKINILDIKSKEKVELLSMNGGHNMSLTPAWSPK